MKVEKEGTVGVKPDGTLEVRDFQIDAEGESGIVYEAVWERLVPVGGVQMELLKLAEDRVLLAAQKIREKRGEK